MPLHGFSIWCVVPIRKPNAEHSNNGNRSTAPTMSIVVLTFNDYKIAKNAWLEATRMKTKKNDNITDSSTHAYGIYADVKWFDYNSWCICRAQSILLRSRKRGFIETKQRASSEKAHKSACGKKLDYTTQNRRFQCKFGTCKWFLALFVPPSQYISSPHLHTNKKQRKKCFDLVVKQAKLKGPLPPLIWRNLQSMEFMVGFAQSVEWFIRDARVQDGR